MEEIELRPLSEYDATALFNFSKDLRIWEYMTFSLNSLTDFETFVKKEIELVLKKESIAFVVLLKDSNEVIGFTKLYNINYGHKTLSSGLTWINPVLWSKGMNIRIKLFILDYCFNSLEMKRVQYVVDERNLRSQKSLINMNAKFEGVFRNFRDYPNDLYKNSFIYSHIIDEWEFVRQHLILLIKGL